MNRWRARWSTRPLCCSGVLVGTKRMLALVTASQMASASAASFFCRLNVGLHIGRWDQPHGVTQCLELARPVVRRGAGFDTDQTGRQLLEERQDVAALQLAANDHLAAS